MKIAVLGAGMIGQTIATDLAGEYSVTCIELNPANLQEVKKQNASIHAIAADLSQTNRYADLLAPFDLVVIAVPGFMGFKTLAAVIEAGKNVVDISFFPEDAFQLDQRAKSKKVTALVDCGVAPGLSNLILGRHNEEMKISSFTCYVGGLPKEKKPPFFYKAPFSPRDVIQEYIRPARMIEDGKLVTKPAMSDREILRFEEAGELEAFNTDGLRTLVSTMSHIPFLKEKTLRYPGHIGLIISLRDAGFFDEASLRIGDVEVSPLAFTSQLLADQWKLLPGEEEFTIMKILIKGEGKTIGYELFDEYDKTSGRTSMARVTGYTCTAMANLVAKNLFSGTGVFPPECIGKEKDCFDFVMDYLLQRNVAWRKVEE